MRKDLVGANPERFVYDEAGQLIGEYGNQGLSVKEPETVYLNDIPVATMKTNAPTFYIYADHLNTPRRIVNEMDQLVWRWDIATFGATPAIENPSGLGAFTYNLRFPGQRYDSETGLHYNYYRDYDPRTGRYVE